tara:strand:+ start:141 stop:575 length:435 start_codon:yes stop_codon:yes gene_type:complete
MKIAIGSDHAGFKYKEILKVHLQNKGMEVMDFGTNSSESCDYPDYIHPVAESVAKGECIGGIVLGGSGNGEAISANKAAGIRCALCWDEYTARMCKEHNNANLISIGERTISSEMAKKIVDIWLTSKFEGGRHQRRIDKIEVSK